MVGQYQCRLTASSRPSPFLSERTYSVISSRSSRNLASDWISPMSCSRVILKVFGSWLEYFGDQAHDVVIVNDRGGEENELEVKLVNLGVPASRALLLPETPGGFEVGALEGSEVVLGKDLLDLLALRLGEVGVLVELGLEALNPP